MRVREVAIAVTAALALAACTTEGAPGLPEATIGVPGPDTTLPPLSALPAACDLLSTADVEAVLGEPVESSSSDGVNCFWRPVGDEGGTTVILSLVPLDLQSCLDVHQALGNSSVFDYEGATAAGVTGFWQYRQTLSETWVGGYELCTPLVNVGLRVETAEGAAADEAGARAMADQLAPLVLQRLSEAVSG